jgi:hypothetical protein
MKLAGMLVMAACAWAQDAPPSYKNLEILKGMPPERVPMVMNVFNRVLGVQCLHCHVEGAMENGEKPQFAMTRKMFHMRNWIASEQKVNVTCWTCHHGSTKPIQTALPAKDFWPPELNLTPEQQKMPAAQVYKNLKFFTDEAGQMRGGMNFLSASLGVGCEHCHVEGAWEKDDKPAKNTARKMLAMVRDLRQQFTDVGRIGCYTCHRGAAKPEVNPPAQ